MVSKLQPPGSMLRPPSKIADLRTQTGLGATTKRKGTDIIAPKGMQPQLETGLQIPTANRQIKMPVSKIEKPHVGTVHAGRRSSSGFKVTPKQDRNANSISAAFADIANIGDGPKFTTGALPRPAQGGARGGSRQAARPGVGRRVPATRTSVTQGRANGGKVANAAAAAPSKLASSNLPLPGSIKRRRIDAPETPGTNPFSFTTEIAGKPSIKTSENANEAEDDNDNEDEDDDEDDDDEKDIGPPPVLRTRAHNDYDGRLKDLEAFSRYMIKKNKTTRKKKKLLSVELEQNSVQVTQLEYDNKILTAKLEDAEKQARLLQTTIEGHERRLQAEKRRHEDEIDDLQRKHKRQSEQLEDEQRTLKKAIADLQETLDTTKSTLQSKREECIRLEATISKQASDQVEMESGNRNLKAKVEHLEDVVNEREIRIAELEDDVASRSQTVNELEEKLRKEETMRRRLHNTIQELKGNIRVFCRVRPLLSEEKNASASLPINFPECDDNNEIELAQSSENALGKTTSKVFPFKFDRVFAPQSSQDVVFEEVSQLIQSALDGYPVCIFAYGQTGSGKTHTMQGPDTITSATNEADLGIIPRAVKQIYENTSNLSERGWEYTLEGQFLEIYNETLQDLLAPSSRNTQGSEKQAKLDIYQDNEGHTRVKNITAIKVDSAERVNWLLARAAENRTVAATNCNERSSRSHSVFTLYLCGKNSLTGESSTGVLNLIDLAGSERLSSSGSSGDRLKETQAINKSLACLGDVIAALAKGNRHVPYRNSKLTHLLQESLGAGNSKTLMFVCVNPNSTSAQESLCSLQFATKVNSCQIGTARRQAAS
ncbi:P-loop containing nucleoside triphosphate hydrolase protein [Coemansia spiralis]|nr:P-loop containing nucleoside triphosphate hydrolase protein [Coemansia spiralis]